ncbi:MAG: histidine phosphatase family protein [Anaerolineales bacterium]|nr:histidine phosphatase family protein [Anaerolineales bacterium]
MIDFKLINGKGNIYFMRHGESEGNTAGIAQGHTNYHLSARGERQAEEAAGWFKKKGIDAILTSPLHRASQTAGIVAAELGLDNIQFRDELIELDIGPFSGLTWKEAAERHPEIYRQFRQTSWEGVPGAERIADLLVRAGEVWQMLFEKMNQNERNILCVTHSGLLQWIIKATIGSEAWLPLFPLRNCSVYHLTIDNGLIPADPIIEEETPAYYWAWKHIDLISDGEQ